MKNPEFQKCLSNEILWAKSGSETAGRLSPRRFSAGARRIDAHLAACAACANTLSKMRLLRVNLQAGALDFGNVAPSLEARTLDALALTPSAIPARNRNRPWRSAIAAGAMLTASLAGSVFLKPGVPLGPDAALARVESAMARVKTARWEETASYAPKTVDRVYASTNPARIVRFGNASGTLTFTEPSGTHWMLSPNLCLIFRRSGDTRADIDRLVRFSPTRGQSEDRDDAPYRWRHAAWKMARVSLGGAPALKFSRHSVRFRDDTGYWRKRTPQEFDQIVFADPKTYRMRRMEWRQVAGVPGKSVSIRENFVYDAPLPETLANVGVKTGRTLRVMDVTDIRGDYATVSSADRRAILDALPGFAARNPATAPAVRNLWRSFEFDLAKTDRVTYAREFEVTVTDPASFPPPLPRNRAEVPTFASGVTIDGKPLRCRATVRLSKAADGAWRVESVGFFPKESRAWETPAQAYEKGARAAMGKK